MNPIFTIGERVVFAIARDIEVLIVQRQEFGGGVYSYLVVWMHNGDRKEAWVNACELKTKEG